MWLASAEGTTFDLHDPTDRAIAADWLEEHGCTTTLPAILRTCKRFTYGPTKRGQP